MEDFLIDICSNLRIGKVSIIVGNAVKLKRPNKKDSRSLVYLKHLWQFLKISKFITRNGNIFTDAFF